MSWFESEHDCSCSMPYDKDHCQYGIWAPGRNYATFERDVIDNTAFNLFAMETEQAERMSQVIEYLGKCPDPNDQVAQSKALSLAGLCFENLTSGEIKYIEEKVAQKWLENHS